MTSAAVHDSEHASRHAPLHVLGALALELRGDAPVARAALTQAEAGALVELMARDLAKFAPEAAGLQLVTVGAHYDPVELLRPGWALHRELDQLAARAPGHAAGRDHRVRCTRGTATRRAGAVAGFLRRAAATGAVSLLSGDMAGGDADVIARVGDRFERELIERGMAGADTALAAQEAFGLQIEHARYLTAHDLAAMTALQYEHAGLAPLWPLLETALLEPDGEAWLDAPPEPLLHYVEGETRIALFEPHAWKQRYAPDADGNDPAMRERLEQLHTHFQARQRQIAAVLGAHGVAVTFVHCADATTAHAQAQ